MTNGSRKYARIQFCWAIDDQTEEFTIEEGLATTGLILMILRDQRISDVAITNMDGTVKKWLWNHPRREADDAHQE